MTRFGMKAGIMAVLLVIALALPAVATPPVETAQIDYIGFGYVMTVNPFSLGPSTNDMSSELTIEAVADDADPAFEVDLNSSELTFHVYGLVPGDVVDTGTTKITYFNGGTLEIWQDGAMNADWGINPPNPTAPGTFIDGTLFFRGNFNGFTMYLNDDGSGAFEGSVNAIEGDMIDGSCTECVYTWGGAFTRDAVAQIPSGYDFQIDGVFQIDSSVANETTNWGSVKALFN